MQKTLTKTEKAWFQQDSYSYSVRWSDTFKEWDVQVWLSEFSSISFREKLEADAHNRVLEEVEWYEETRF